MEGGMVPPVAKVYALAPERYTQLIIYCLASFMCPMMWSILAPIYTIAEAKFDVGTLGINALSNVWNIVTGPGAILALWAMERHGLRWSLLVGCVTQLLGCIGSWASCVTPGLTPHGAYSLLYCSQVLGAVGQPLVLNNIARVAGDWFPADQRDMAVTVSVLSVAAGSVFIGILAPLVVHKTEDLQVVFFWQVPCWAAIVAWGAFSISDGPEDPPSAAAELQRLRRASTQRSLASLGYTPDSGALQQVWENAIILLGDSNFMCLAWSVSILTGMGYAYLTVIGQLLGPCGYSDNLVGDSIAAFSAANAVGCILYVYMLSHEGNSRSYQAYQVWFSASLALCLAIALVTASPGEPVWVVVVLWSILGMAAGPLMGPLPIEHAAEMTFPVPANASTTVLNLIGAVVSFFQVVVATPLLQLESSTDCLTIWTPFALFTVANCVVGLALAICIKSDYRRQELESSFANGDDLMKLAGPGVLGGKSSALSTSVSVSWGAGLSGAAGKKGEGGDDDDDADDRGFARLGERGMTGYGTAGTSLQVVAGPGAGGRGSTGYGGLSTSSAAGPVGSGLTAVTTPPGGAGGGSFFSNSSSGALSTGAASAGGRSAGTAAASSGPARLGSASDWGGSSGLTPRGGDGESSYSSLSGSIMGPRVSSGHSLGGGGGGIGSGGGARRPPSGGGGGIGSAL